jgi:hypothetical protein
MHCRQLSRKPWDRKFLPGWRIEKMHLTCLTEKSADVVRLDRHLPEKHLNDALHRTQPIHEHQKKNRRFACYDPGRDVWI